MSLGGHNGHIVKVHEGWRDNVQPFLSAKLGAAKNPTFATINGAIGSYSFSPTQEQELFMYFHINHDYKEGTALFPHIHWCPSTANAGNVRWGIEWAAARGHNQETFNASEIIYIDQEAPGIVDQHMVAEMDHPGLFIPALEADAVILCRVFRAATDVNDTYPDPVFGFMADLHYYSDRYTTINKRPDFNRR